MLNNKRILILLLAVILSSVAGGQGGRMSSNKQDEKKNELSFRLSEGKEDSKGKPAPTPKPNADRLSDDATQKILSRLPAIKSESGDEKDFVIREGSQPAPKTGQTIKQVFPSEDSASKPDTTSSVPFEVVRFTPNGDVPFAPHLSVTFSQPMVPVTSVSDLASSQVPVKLSPQPKGKWRWIGTKTLLFEPEHRFPMATNYTAEVPTGVKSISGSSLTIPKKWTFSTPPLQMTSTYPYEGEPQSLDPIFFIEFNQKIDKSEILRYINLKPATQLRLATDDEINSSPQVKNMVGGAVKDQWIAFKANASSNAKPLIAGTKYEITLAKGAKGGEGDRGTLLPQSYFFHTAGPLAIVKYNCDYDQDCKPGSQLTIHFNNPLDEKTIDKSKIKIEPAVSHINVIPNGTVLMISGEFKGSTTYKVTIDNTISDVFGQTLVQDKALMFIFGRAPQEVMEFHSPLAVLDPFGNKTFNIRSINHSKLKVSLYSVSVENWKQFNDFMKSKNYNARMVGRKGILGLPMPAIGRLISSKIVTVKSKLGEMVETSIELKPALKSNFGHVILSVEAVQPPDRAKNEYDYERRAAHVWIQSTNIALDTYFDMPDLVTRVTSLSDGKGLKDVSISMVKDDNVSKALSTEQISGVDGLARIPVPESTDREPFKRLIVAHSGKDISFIPENLNNIGTPWHRGEQREWLLWNVFTDRNLYRPSEEVHFKGMIRIETPGPQGDVIRPKDKIKQVEYTISDSRGNKLSNGTVDLDLRGGFDFKYSLPSTVNLGYAYVQLKAGRTETYFYNEHSQSFRVEEFRRPEYEVKANATDALNFISNPSNLVVEASYYAGGPLADSKVNWHVTASKTNYTPPNRSDFIFGKWKPWWRYDFFDSMPDRYESFSSDYAGRTDQSGKHHLKLEFDSKAQTEPLAITAHANVEDVNRQSIGSSTNFIAHPSSLYVGIRSPRTFVEKGQPIIIDSIVVDIDGNAKVDREFRISAVLLEWVFEDGQWKQKEKTKLPECVRKSANDPVQCKFDTTEGGPYRIVASVIDDKERRNQSEMTICVAGEKLPSDRNLEADRLPLIPDRKEYKTGDTAEILVEAPFYPAEGLLTIRRSGLVSTQTFSITDSSYTLKIPITDQYVPNFHVQIDIAGVKTYKNGKLSKEPAYASGSLDLKVPPLKRTLKVTATPQEKATEPGKETSIDVQLHDADGNAVNSGDVTLIVVDDAVLTMAAYKIPDPISVFYRQRGDGVYSDLFRKLVIVQTKDGRSVTGVPGGVSGGSVGGVMDSVAVNGRLMRPQARMSAAYKSEESTLSPPPSPEPGSQINLRLDFNPLAAFVARVTTDINGRATVKFKLPDNLTRYRVVAVADSGENYFGIGESSITARLPLMVRPSAPRFLNFGDKFELPVVVQNQTDQPMKVDVAVRASNADFIDDGARLKAALHVGQSVTVPANDRVEIRFPALAKNPGTARFQIAGASGSLSDSAEINLPVWTPATTEAFATYGEVDSGAIAQTIKVPSDAVKQFGGLDITTSSTQLQSLTDAVIYLTNYPFECAEQISSRLMAISALRDVLAAFDAKGLPKPAELIDQVNRDLVRLKSLQRHDGGFGFWGGQSEAWPYISIHAAHAMLRAKEKGFDVPADMYQKSQEYLNQIDNKFPKSYDVETRRTLKAYALYVRYRMGQNVIDQALTLIYTGGGVEKISIEALGWLLPVLSKETKASPTVAAINKYLNNRVEETAGAAHFTSSYKDGGYLLLASDRRADGVLLDSLIQTNPKSDLIPKIVRGLLGNRKQGRWMNTQENAFILLALDRYFQTYEKTTPEFVAKVWLGDSFAGDLTFNGRSVDSKEINVPMNWLMERQKTQNLVMSKEGAGRLYYRIGMKYAPENLQLKPSDNGFTVTRTYEAIDDSNDVRRQEDGTWRIKAGARVRVRVNMVAQARRYHVALVDPMPAGFEALNPSLATSGPVPPDTKEPGSVIPYWYRTWFDHQNMRDERVEAFTSLLWEGVHNYSYVARATTPGVFIVPPSKAEEMYNPETFGRAGTDRVIIE